MHLFKFRTEAHEMWTKRRRKECISLTKQEDKHRSSGAANIKNRNSFFLIIININVVISRGTLIQISH